jgi:hypothetical protein
MDPKVVGFIDIGTNSIRLLLVRINPNQSYSTLSVQKETIRLGEGEFADGYLRPEAILEVYCDQDCQLELWGVQNHEKAFQKAFKRVLQVNQIPVKKSVALKASASPD